MARLVALLRGINLGAKRRVAMADLRDAAGRARLHGRPHRPRQRQRRSSPAPRPRRARSSRRRSRSASASRSTSSCARWRSCTRSSTHDPFGDEVDEPDALLRRLPRPASRDARARSTGRTSRPTSFAANGTELYAWCPDGMQNSRLMKALGKPGSRTPRPSATWPPSRSCWSEQPFRGDPEPVEQPPARPGPRARRAAGGRARAARVAREPRVQRGVQARRARAR